MIGFGLAGGLAHGHTGAMLWIALAFLAVGGAADMVSCGVPVDDPAAGGLRRICAAGCRECSPSSSPEGPGWLMRCTARPPRRWARRWPPQVVACWWWSAWWSPALVVPAFVRYRVAETDDKSLTSGNCLTLSLSKSIS